MPKRYLYLTAIAVVLACASGGGGSASHRDSNVITERELSATPVANAYDAIERLRPLFLRSRGNTSINTPGTQYPTVYVDGVRYGDLSSLRNILPSHVVDIRYYNGAEAGSKFGLQNTAGVIEVRMK